MPRSRTVHACLVLGCLAAGVLRAAGDDLEFFEKRVRPVLVEHCYSCHSGTSEKLKAGLRVDSREHLLQGGDAGPAIVPGASGQSLLIRAISYEDPDLQMPPKTRLAAESVRDLRRWIDAGAPWPAATPAVETGASRGSFDVAARRAAHWAWSPVRAPEIPKVRDPEWGRQEIDAFVLTALETAGLKPAPDTDRSALLRRASFVVTGLPPTPAERAAFLSDASPEAWERAVDRLLASPHFGERWARHWLDKVRYSETLGHEFDYPVLGAWRYRDYVVRAFNDDLPYGQFAREQIAGDLMAPRRDGAGGLDETRLATLQYWFGQQVHSPVDVRANQVEVVDNQIDVLTKAFLGMTVSCARCHDHKFDAVSARDYYALFGILGSSRYTIRAVDDPAARMRQADEVRQARDAWRRTAADRLLARTDDPWGTVTHAGGAIRPRAQERLLPLEGWFREGEAFAEGEAGQPAMLADGRVGLVRAGWWHGGAVADRLQGALRSPTFRIDDDFIHLRLAGRGARFTLSVEGFSLVRAPIYGALRQPVRMVSPHWVTLDVRMWKGRNAYLELADYTAADPASELSGEAASADGWVAIGGLVFSAHREPPEVESVPAPPDARSVIRQWRDQPGTLSSADADWLEAVLSAVGPTLPASRDGDWGAAAAGVPAPVLVAGMTEGTGTDEPVFIRGNPRTVGPVVERRFLEALSDLVDAEGFREGTGRQALAGAITDPANPLFHRVMVNWVWSHVFGRGIVASTDNFGVLGERPSHPELLDWLASRFVADGESVKMLLRRLLLSRTFQMSSRSDPASDAVDPENILLHRANVRRLEGESIRDAVLAVSGRLDRTVGGPPVAVHLTPFMDGRGRPQASGPVDGDGRRSVYLEVRRNFLNPTFLAFDTPNPATTVGRRTVSNVPAQALAMMNDPFVAEQARGWAARVCGGATQDTPPGELVSRLYLEAFGREPSGLELGVAGEFLAAAGLPDGWTDLCHALLNTKEFLFVP